MINSQISIQERTRNFANRVIKVYIELNKRKYDDVGKVLSKQFLRSGTSIGANCSEAEFSQSRADFRAKLYIALKEASECRYWMQLMIDNNIIPESKLSLILDEINQIIKILIATSKKLKE